ncbi:molybdate ABC transporter permease ModB [Fictibacillus macauensis ZFHKF-1]|uniref:Molybdenum transport system permease n=1 Tax=Fictibacillus macauensis ZFHKF-1 TaxID=1196324 RepID=I8AKA0_9BACL|nr:molybdate ABC transporter permease subunit [Fictibacillus macauensis]EIT85969.1 molybdate ABC transporter permease ModB [Fictibacillus macauensis ZFHKF-1]
MPYEIWSPIQLSISVAIASVSIVTVLGILLAKGMARKVFKGKIMIETMIMLPLVLPPTVIGFLLIIVFGKSSWLGQFIETLFHQPIIFTWWAAVIASSVVALPLMYQSVKTGLEAVDEDIEGAAFVDGASSWQVFLRITLPLASQAVITGIILSFARALGEFGATLMFAGNIPGVTETIPTAIYVAIDSGNRTEAWLLVGASICISFLLLALTYKRRSS